MSAYSNEQFAAGAAKTIAKNVPFLAQFVGLAEMLKAVVAGIASAVGQQRAEAVVSKLAESPILVGQYAFALVIDVSRKAANGNAKGGESWPYLAQAIQASGHFSPLEIAEIQLAYYKWWGHHATAEVQKYVSKLKLAAAQAAQAEFDNLPKFFPNPAYPPPYPSGGYPSPSGPPPAAVVPTFAFGLTKNEAIAAGAVLVLAVVGGGLIFGRK